MQYRGERRRQNRYPLSGSVYLIGETENGPFEIRGSLANVSGSGIGVLMRENLKPGTVVWCASPGQGIYERGQVCYSSGSLLRKGATGIRFLASMPRENHD